ncbi:WD40/YVTN repeat-like-containing domain superfamily [Sesbania bispinosa]|nr:WD40/YVTN repeat-like-containing domain superfamily [Sesbania bispinosa]
MSNFLTNTNPNPNKSFEVNQPPTDSVSSLCFSPKANFLVATSWDNQVRCWEVARNGVNVATVPKASISMITRYWDTRQSNPVHTQQLPERCYAMTVRHPLMVVGTADRNLIVYNLQNPQVEFKRIVSPLKYQTRCLAAFPDQQGFLVGSIEGRVGVHHLDDSQQGKNFTFKCHREGNEIYSVNSLNFHPVHHTFATAGSDGAFNFWDKDSKQRLKA